MQCIVPSLAVPNRQRGKIEPWQELLMRAGEHAVWVRLA